MLYPDLSKTQLTAYRNVRICKSRGGEARLSEVVFQQGGEIGPHIHPGGEDSALVLSGELSYYVSNRKTVKAKAGELVPGRRNMLHGYRNDGPEPLHLLIFVAPGSIGLGYPSDEDPSVIDVPQEERKWDWQTHGGVVRSEYSRMEAVDVTGVYEEAMEPDLFKVFVDVESKGVYVFDGEPVRLEMGGSKRLLKFAARS